MQNITGIDVAKISFEEEEILNETQYTQICILTMSLAIIELLKQNEIYAEVSAGLSLGEYSALIYSKALSVEEGIRLVKKRGEYMQYLAPKGEWRMAALLGVSEEQVAKICNKVKNGFATPVNFNCPGQIVVSGDQEGLEEVELLAKETGVKKVRILKTSGPFHTKKLTSSSDALRKELENITFHDFETDVIKNLDGKPYEKSDNLADILAKHIINPVYFGKSIETMLSMGVDTFIEVGPGKTLSGFVKRIPTQKEINILHINNVESLNNVIEVVKQ